MTSKAEKIFATPLKVVKLTGTGVCDKCESLQEEISRVTNMKSTFVLCNGCLKNLQEDIIEYNQSIK